MAVTAARMAMVSREEDIFMIRLVGEEKNYWCFTGTKSRFSQSDIDFRYRYLHILSIYNLRKLILLFVSVKL